MSDPIDLEEHRDLHRLVALIESAHDRGVDLHWIPKCKAEWSAIYDATPVRGRECGPCGAPATRSYNDKPFVLCLAHRESRRRMDDRAYPFGRGGDPTKNEGGPV